MRAGFGQTAITCAVGAAALGIYSEYRDVSEVFHLVNGLLGLIAMICAVLWWRSSAQDDRVSRR